MREKWFLRFCVRENGTDGRTPRRKNNANEQRTLCACKLQLVINQWAKSYRQRNANRRHATKEHKERFSDGMCKSFCIASRKKKKKVPKARDQKKKKTKNQTFIKSLFPFHSCSKRNPGRKPPPRRWRVLRAAAQYLTACLLRR